MNLKIPLGAYFFSNINPISLHGGEMLANTSVCGMLNGFAV
jgi:hypothetical protein